MKQYEVNLTYKDEKSLKVMIKQEEISKFFQNLTAGEVYRHPDTKIGFWTNLNDVRYITVQEKEAPSVEVVKRAEPSLEKLPDGDEEPEGREEEDK